VNKEKCMADIILFPDKDSRFKSEIEEMLDKSLNIANPDARKCIKERITDTLTKYTVPSLSVTFTSTMSEEDVKSLTDALQEEYIAKTTEFFRKLISDMCILQAKLCKCEHGE
jgi:hypothetical protein